MKGTLSYEEFIRRQQAGGDLAVSAQSYKSQDQYIGGKDVCQ